MPYDLEITAVAADIDELRHVSNLVYLRWVQEVAIAHSTALGWAGAAYQRLGSSWGVRRHEIDYVVPVFERERIRLTTADHLGRVGQGRVVGAADLDEQEVASPRR